MDQLELLEACRICITCFPLKDMDFINIFQPNEEFQRELDFIQGEIHQWQLKIYPYDSLPQRICANCFAKFCSIHAFRQECESTQNKLIESLKLHAIRNVPDVHHVIKNTETPLPLVGNYGTGNVSLDSANNVLVSSQSELSLNDFPLYDQQFSHYDNPALMDASSTLLHSHLIAPEITQELSFLPSQNLFTFETAEPPSTGSLPLGETETASIMNEMVKQKSSVEGVIKQDDLEEILQHSIIPTTTKLAQQNSRLNDDQHLKETTNPCINVKSEYRSATSTFLNREDSNSDVECEDTDMNIRLKGLSYACHYCFCPEAGSIDHLVFPNADALSQHFFDIHDPNRPYTCPTCPQACETKTLRDNHVKLVHKIIEIQTCNYCQKRFKGSTDVHQYNCLFVGDWQCEQCKENFPKTPLYRFRHHQRQHERPKHFKCHLCERSFVRKANLEAHERMHKAKAQSTHICNICKTSFHDDYELKRHKHQQHNADAPLECNSCNKDFTSNVLLQRHIKQFHLNNINNVNNKSSIAPSSSSSSTSISASPSSEHNICLNCNVDFKTLQKLQGHLLMGRDKNGNCLYTSSSQQERRKFQRQGVFPCFHCPRRFHLRSQLDKHLNTHDARRRPFQCEQCVMRCRTAFELKQHVNVSHLNIKAFSCDTCGKCFGYKKDLRDHMLFHAEINVPCTEESCDYVCKNEKALNDHIRHKHRLLSCEYCHEQFTRQKLTAHLRKIHRSEIDVDLASESDNFYKSQLLNNNNDITQISFNLLNTQQQLEQQISKTLPQLSPIATATATPTSVLSKNVAASLTQSISLTPTSTSLLTMPPITSNATASSSSTSSTSSSSQSSCLISNTKGTNLSYNSTSISEHNIIDNVDHDNNDQLRTIFANDSHNSNGTTLALNGLVSNEHDLNLVVNDTTNMFIVPSSSSTSSTANDNQFDQYFMSSLIDTEQEIIVT